MTHPDPAELILHEIYHIETWQISCPEVVIDSTFYQTKVGPPLHSDCCENPAHHTTFSPDKRCGDIVVKLDN